MTGGDLCNILCPCLPILTASTLLYDFCIDVILPLVQLCQIKSKLGTVIAVTIAIDAVGVDVFIKARNANNRNIIWLILVQFDTVDGVIETVIMRTESLQYVPYNFILFVFCKRCFWLHASRNTNRQNNIAILLAFTLAHDTAYRLDNVHNRTARAKEHNRIQRWNVHTFRQTASVGKDTAGVFPCIPLQPVDAVLAFKGVGFAVNVL